MTETDEIKVVSEYAGVSFIDAVELDCYTFKCLVRDGFIFKMRQTEKGQEYLENCWILTQTAPDKDSLRKRFSKGGIQ